MMMKADLVILGDGLLRVDSGYPPQVISAATITHVAEVSDALHVHWAGGWIVLEGWTQDAFAEVWEAAVEREE